MNKELWEQWSACHDAPDQQKRLSSAKTAACTPIELDRDAGTGTFSGSSGTHSASLDKCSCIDFNRRRLPCKHMYRLAMELGLIEASFKTDISAVVQPRPRSQIEKIEHTVEVIESLTDYQQYLLLEIIRKITTKNPTVGLEVTPDVLVLLNTGLLEQTDDVATAIRKSRKDELVMLATSFGCENAKKMKKPELVDFLISNHFDDLKGKVLGYASVRQSPHVKYGKVRMYLHRKFDSELCEDETGNLFSVPMLQLELPHDDVTALLIQYGYYHPQ